MNPQVIAVQEARKIDALGRPTKAIVVTYKVGPYGPFTLETNQIDLQSGAAMQQMQAFAATLGNLPTPPAA